MTETHDKAETEIIAVCSGKGGTGKTLVAICLANALIRSGNRVLMIDTDTGTYGLSLYLFGPGGEDSIDQFSENETFIGILQNPDLMSQGVTARTIYRHGMDDHQVDYDTLVCGKQIYGDDDGAEFETGEPLVERTHFESTIKRLFEELRQSGQYDYIIVDTRGGFGFLSTDACALADSYLLVTEAQRSTLYQDRNLVTRIDKTAAKLGKKAFMRGVLVNKAVGDEGEFRSTLEGAFPIKFHQTYPIPIDLEAVKATKAQLMPYVRNPASPFAHGTLTAFASILHTVTSRWEGERVRQWNQLVDEVKDAIRVHNKEVEAKQKHATVAGNKRAIIAAAIGLVAVLITYSVYAQQVRSLSTQNSTLMSATRKLEQELSDLAKMKERYSRDGLQTSVYSTETPLATRLRDMKQLISEGVTDFPGVKFNRMSLDSAELRGLNLQGAELEKATLTEADLSESRLVNAVMQESDLTRANLSGANLKGADLKEAILLGADVSNADFSNAKLAGAKVDSEDWVKRLTGVASDAWKLEKTGETWVIRPREATQD